MSAADSAMKKKVTDLGYLRGQSGSERFSRFHFHRLSISPPLSFYRLGEVKMGWLKWLEVNMSSDR